MNTYIRKNLFTQEHFTWLIESWHTRKNAFSSPLRCRHTYRQSTEKHWIVVSRRWMARRKTDADFRKYWVRLFGRNFINDCLPLLLTAGSGFVIIYLVRKSVASVVQLSPLKLPQLWEPFIVENIALYLLHALLSI